MHDSAASDTQPQPKRRFLDRGRGAPTLIGAGSHCQGDLHCAGDLSVAGHMVGDAKVQGMLSLADTGSWQGAVQCAQALVAGQLNGRLMVDGKLEIRSTARISGHITAQQLAIAEGALIEAEITVLSGAPIQRFVEKRQG